MGLETDRLVLRPWEERDRPAMAGLLADAEVRRYYPSVLTREQSDALLDRVIAQAASDGFAVRAAEVKRTGRLAGWIGLSRIPDDVRSVLRGHPEIEIGWLLDKTLWGQGLAPEGARAWLDYGFRTLGAAEIVAFTFNGNSPSRRVMEKLGMSRDPEDDFEHPRVPVGHVLRSHVLYRIQRS